MENFPRKQKKIVLTEEEKKSILDAVETLSDKEGEALAGGQFGKVVVGFSKALSLLEAE